MQNTSRMTEVAVGISIRDTSTPAMNGDSEYCGPSGVAKKGIQPRCVVSQAETPIRCGWRKKKPHTP